jgi:hypothetical protein
MKQQDLATIGGAIIVSVVLSIILAKFTFGSFKEDITTYQVPPITASFPQPSSQYFNSSSTDPTQIIRIGASNNQTPFLN